MAKDEIPQFGKGTQTISKDQQIELLQKEIERLNSSLADAKEINLDSAARSEFFSGVRSEVPTGRTVKIRRCKNPYVKNEAEQLWEEIEVPTYLYHINMPPVGGVDIKLDGEEKYHGQTYEMTMNTLRTVKDIVYRIQAHEASIHGSDEDTYRPRVSKQISIKTGRIQNLPPNWLPGMPAPR